MRRIYKIEVFLSLLLPLVAVLAAFSQTPSKLTPIWDLEITVPPQPTTPNRITFSGGEAAGTFVDKNGHSGTWERSGNRVTWMYKSVPDLTNVFSGELNAEWTAMTGTNEGKWQGSNFKGTWKGVAVSQKSSAEMWREDLRYLAAELPKRHKNLFHTMTREQFDAAVRDLDAKIPMLSQNQIAMEFGRSDSHPG